MNTPIPELSLQQFRALYLKAGIPGTRIEQMYNEQAGNKIVELVK